MYVHSNLNLIYEKREEWVKGKTKMWDVFPDDMSLDSSIELALANMDLNDPMLEPVTFDDSDRMKGSSSTAADADHHMGRKEEEGDEDEDHGRRRGSDEYADVDSGMEEDY